MRVSLFVGDLADSVADAVCTSTNPRLSLMMGTGAAIRGRGGYGILRACEQILVDAKGELPLGSAHSTTAGDLPHKMAIHCVASDSDHHSSEEVVKRCVNSALAVAEAGGCRSVAMPIFATGHARVSFPRAVSAMAEALRNASTAIADVTLVIFDPEQAEQARALVQSVFGGVVPVTRSEKAEETPGSWWSADE